MDIPKKKPRNREGGGFDTIDKIKEEINEQRQSYYEMRFRFGLQKGGEGKILTGS